MGVNKVSILIWQSLTILVCYESPKRGTQYGRERAEEVLRRIQAHTETFQNAANFVLSGSSSGPWCVKQAMVG